MKFSNNKTYDVLKFVALVVLPALATFVVVLNGIWDIPNHAAYVGTIVAFDTFLGAVLGLSANQYQNDPDRIDGFLDASGADPDTGNPNLKMTVTKHPDDLLQKKIVRLKVGKAPRQ